MQGIEPTSNDIYQYLNFDQISQYQKSVGHIAHRNPYVLGGQFYENDKRKKIKKQVSHNVKRRLER
jgi:hypothetical protein